MGFKEVYKIDVSQMTEKKNGLTYLSWANAWKEFKNIYPEGTYEVKKDENGKCWFGDDEHGYVVYTTVTVEEITYEMWLPVMDYRNKSILKPTTFDINKAVMRCLTKNLAMFGLGLYIYAGEDLPEEPVKDDTQNQAADIPKEKPTDLINPLEAKTVIDSCAELHIQVKETFLDKLKLDKVEQMTKADYIRVMTAIEKARIKQANESKKQNT